MPCSLKWELRRTAVMFLVVVIAANRADCALWTISTPTLNEVFGVGAGIGGNGTGPADVSFTIKVKSGDMTVNSKLSGTSPEENWEDVIDPPSPGVWTTATGVTTLAYQIWKNGELERTQSIKINNPGEV